MGDDGLARFTPFNKLSSRSRRYHAFLGANYRLPV
jgi:hypothetical protein